MAGRFRDIVRRLRAGGQPGAEAPPPAAGGEPQAASRCAGLEAPPQGPGEGTGGLAAFFEADHRRCDALWAEVERAGGDDRLSAVEAFVQAVRNHLAMEEDVLFPAFEEATGMAGMGPTVVMRSEHEQMRGVLDLVERAALAGDFDEVLDQGDTLHILTQQHNSKEEQVLYPASEMHLAGRWDELRPRLERYLAG